MKKMTFIYKPKTQAKKKITLFKPVESYNRTNVRNIDKRKLNWAQASIRYPKMKAFGDSDRDGVLNAWDCKPFNENKHGILPLPLELPPAIQSAAVGVLAVTPLMIMEKKRQMILKERERRRLIDRQRAIDSQKRIAQWKAARARQSMLNIRQDMNNRPETFDQIRAKAWQRSKSATDTEDVQRQRDTEFRSGRGTTVVRKIFDPAREGVKFN